MIYKLPTQGFRNYRGLYPTRIASVSASKGCVHVELNRGARYVASYSDVLSGNMPKLGEEFRTVFGVQAELATPMALADYAGVLFMIRLVRSLRHAKA